MRPLFAGQCQCMHDVRFELPALVYDLTETIDLGACPECGRRYLLSLSVVRNLDNGIGHFPPRSQGTE